MAERKLVLLFIYNIFYFILYIDGKILFSDLHLYNLSMNIIILVWILCRHR